MYRPRTAVWALCLALCAGPAAADQAVYRQVAPSCVQIYEADSDRYFGIGVLVDAKRRLVVTAEHVVSPFLLRGGDEVDVLFAQQEKGRLITDARHYRRNRHKLAIPGRVVYTDFLRDLAVIRLQRLPDGAREVPLAADDPDPGEQIHVVGDSTLQFGAAFGYCGGKVRNTFFRISDDYLLRYTLFHQAPTRPGDSGGPVVNDKGELVAIVSMTLTNNQKNDPQSLTWELGAGSAHVKEVRAVLGKIEDPFLRPPVVRTLQVDMTTVPRVDFKDYFFVPVQAGVKVDVEVRGDGRGDLDFEILDESRQAVLRQTGGTDSESGGFTPSWSGLCQIRLNNYAGQATKCTLTAKWGKAVAGPVALVRGIERGTADSLRLGYEEGQKATLHLHGDGTTDLDVAVLGPDGKQVAAGTGPTDEEVLTWEVAATGEHTIRVTNKGDTENVYVLTTN